MADYKFLNDISTKYLEALMNVTTDSELKMHIKNILEKSTEYMAKRFSSDRATFINECFTTIYQGLIDNLKLEDLVFYSDLVCLSKGNNRGVDAKYNILDKSILVYQYPGVRESLFSYDIRHMKQFYNICHYGSRYYEGESDEKLKTEIENIPIVIEANKETQYFKYLETFFQDEESKYYYEGAYNTYMYIKEYLHKMIIQDNTISISNILKETQEKSVIILEYIQEICMYLYELKVSIEKSRISTCNNRLIIQIAKNSEEDETIKKQLAELLAFGITKEELLKMNYSSFERLIYIPRNKPKKKRLF